MRFSIAIPEWIVEWMLFGDPATSYVEHMIGQLRRGRMRREEFVRRMRELGYDEEWIHIMLLAARCAARLVDEE